MPTNNAINLSAAGVTYYNGTGIFSGVTGTIALPLVSTGAGSAPSYSVLTVPGGGTGVGTFTTNGVLLGQGTSSITALSPIANGVLITNNSSVPSYLVNGTAGQVLTANTGAPPSWTTIVTGVSSVTGTANQILASPTTGPVFLSLIGPYTPATYTVNGVLLGQGTSSITALSPIANGVLITNNSSVPSYLVNGTAGQVLTANTGAPPSWTTIVTGVSSVTGTANQILASPTTGPVVLSLIGPYTPSTYTANSLLLGQGTSSITALGVATSGQLPIGTGTAPVLATLTPGTGVSIVNGAGSITISSTGGGLTWTDVLTGPVAAVANTGYIVTGTTGVVFNLPASPTIGQLITVALDGVGASWTIHPNVGQVLVLGVQTSSSGTGGFFSTTANGDTVTLVAQSTSTATHWNTISYVGNISYG